MNETSKKYLLISKAWHKTQIEITICYAKEPEGGIELKVDFDKFLDTLVEEIGNPTMLLTKAQLKKKLHAFSDKLIYDYKIETARVV